jgi:hypothetical protein
VLLLHASAVSLQPSAEISCSDCTLPTAARRIQPVAAVRRPWSCNSIPRSRFSVGGLELRAYAAAAGPATPAVALLCDVGPRFQPLRTAALTWRIIGFAI